VVVVVVIIVVVLYSCFPCQLIEWNPPHIVWFAVKDVNHWCCTPNPVCTDSRIQSTSLCKETANRRHHHCLLHAVIVFMLLLIVVHAVVVFMLLLI
jgi:hypothetical protein